MAKHPDREVLTYKHTDGRVITVYDGTGGHDALRSDPAWERATGSDKPQKIASATAKVGQGAEEVEGLSDAEKRQVAAQAGVSNDPGELAGLSGKQAVDETAKRGRVRK